MQMGKVGGYESRDEDSPTKYSQRPSRRSDKRAEVREPSCPQDWKLYLKANKPQVGQRHKDVKGKRKYYQIFIFLKGLQILHQERKGQVKTIVMEYFNTILYKSLHLLIRSIPTKHPFQSQSRGKLKISKTPEIEPGPFAGKAVTQPLNYNAEYPV